MAAKSAKSPASSIEKALQDIEVIQAFIADTNFYRRKYERRRTSFKTALKIVDSKGKDFDEGTAVCSNLTPEGVLLSKIKLGKKCIPLENFTVKLSLESGALKGLKASASLVYLSNVKGKPQMGLAFTKISRASVDKITRFLGAR
ncbi:MAG: PilZ domain-containing protein [Planctomycetota bacterium]|nr:MAG: PilZ domain-containing protein [Planctomycetota bacterium]